MSENERSAEAAPAGAEGAESASYETNLARLEEIVRELEDGRKELDESLRLFEEGVERYRICSEKLGEAELKITKLGEKLEGVLQREPFEPADD